jgi:hypothetical protein
MNKETALKIQIAALIVFDAAMLGLIFFIFRMAF